MMNKCEIVYLQQNQSESMNILQNIFSFIGTFLVISTCTILLLQGIVCFVQGKWESKQSIDCRIIIVGIIVAFLLIPYYYFPA